MISPEEFMDYWLKHGVVVSDAPTVYYYDEDLIDYTTKMIKEERRKKREGVK